VLFDLQLIGYQSTTLSIRTQNGSSSLVTLPERGREISLDSALITSYIRLLRMMAAVHILSSGQSVNHPFNRSQSFAEVGLHQLAAGQCWVVIYITLMGTLI